MSDERRRFWPNDPAFFDKLEAHMRVEEERQTREDQKLKETAERMTAIEKDLQPLKKMYYAVVGSGGVMALLLATLLYIYGEDKERLMKMQEVIYKQGTAIEVLVRSYDMLNTRADRATTRIDKIEERIPHRSMRQP